MMQRGSRALAGGSFNVSDVYRKLDRELGALDRHRPVTLSLEFSDRGHSA